LQYAEGGTSVAGPTVEHIHLKYNFHRLDDGRI